MASPQIENGHIKIANELFEALYRIRLSGLQKDVFSCVLRFAYGFNKKQAELSIRFIAGKINTKHNRVAEALSKLIDSNMILVRQEYCSMHIGRILSINKNHEEWGRSENEEQSDFEGENSPNMGDTNGPNLRNNIKTLFKDNIKDSAKSVKDILLKEEFEKFWNYYDKKTGKNKCWNKWKRLPKSEKDKIREHLPKYIAATPVKQYRKNPLTYLNGEAWNDEIIIPGKAEDNYSSQISLTNQIGVQ